MVGLTGLEPVTPRLSSACSNQLSYRPHSKRSGGMRIRTADPLLAKQMLYQLSYAPAKSKIGSAEKKREVKTNWRTAQCPSNGSGANV